jgi:hypothetical protein
VNDDPEAKRARRNIMQEVDDDVDVAAAALSGLAYIASPEGTPIARSSSFVTPSPKNSIGDLHIQATPPKPMPQLNLTDDGASTRLEPSSKIDDRSVFQASLSDASLLMDLNKRTTPSPARN